MSAKTKEFLADIYENILHLNWTEKDFRNYIYKCYEDYMKLSVNEIAQWKGYNTAKKSLGFLQFEKGASGISKACGAYNDLLQHYKIANQYDSINVGDKVQFFYVKTPNKFGIDAIVFKGRYPKEFEKDLKIDYAKMFDKSIMSPLKNLMTAMNYQPVEPEQKTLFDVFDF
jgi:DNA polymerase elongation subunit (family B)